MRKILVSAYGCEPYKGSEQAVGWNIVLQLAQHNEVHVITRANNCGPIESFLANCDRNYIHLHFHYYDTSKKILSLKNKEKGVYMYYILWQIGIIGLARRLQKQFNFDYSFHLTFGSIWLPTFLFLLPPTFIWGPLGGGEAIPDSFIKTLSTKGQLLQYLRKILLLSIYVNPIILLPARKAKVLLCRTNDTINVFPKVFRRKCRILTDGAIESEIFSLKRKDEDKNKEYVTLIVTSRLIHTKNIETIIRAVELLSEDLPYRLRIVGSGPDEHHLKQLVTSLGLLNRVEFISALPRNEVFSYLSSSDIYLFASLKEACNLSLLEAMAIGLPIICLNWTGMAISTDDSCAIRLPVTNPEQMPKDMAAAIIKLIENPELRKRMGDAGRKRIKEVFNWEAKGLFMERLFAELDSKR